MLNRLRGLFARYADRHLTFSVPGPQLPEVDGVATGYVDRISIRGNRMSVEGWCIASQLRLTWHGGQVVQRPHMVRADVARAFGVDPGVGFLIEAPVGAGPYELMFQVSGAELTQFVTEPSGPALYRARLRLKWRFALDLLGILPAVLRWRRTRNPVIRVFFMKRLVLV